MVNLKTSLQVSAQSHSVSGGFIMETVW